MCCTQHNLPQVENRNPAELTGRDVHVWPIRIEAPDTVVARFQPLLAPDETARAARFHFDHLQRRFILSRGALRILLGHYLDIAADRIEFSYGSRGKPSLAAPAGIHFNASHSGDVALLAFTLHCEIGVDVEKMRPISDMRGIASRFFCAEESTELMALPPEERERAFFLCWTRKEAYLKAVGEGLYAPLNDFCVTLRPGEPARFIHLRNDAAAAKAWTLHDLDAAPGHAAALAYHDAPRQVHLLPLADPAGLLVSNFTGFRRPRL
jgi:4'-phosphopantetheinyl transferase